MENNTPLTPEDEIKYWAKLYQDVMEENGQNAAALNYWRGEGRIDAKVDSRLKEKDDRIAELERENARAAEDRDRYNHHWKVTVDLLADKKSANKTLMRLLEEEYKAKVWDRYVHFPVGKRQERVNLNWQSFCKEHNLKIDTDGK